MRHLSRPQMYHRPCRSRGFKPLHHKHLLRRCVSSSKQICQASLASQQVCFLRHRRRRSTVTPAGKQGLLKTWPDWPGCHYTSTQWQATPAPEPAVAVEQVVTPALTTSKKTHRHSSSGLYNTADSSPPIRLQITAALQQASSRQQASGTALQPARQGVGAKGSPTELLKPTST